MLPDYLMSKGKTGLFGIIESTANLRNARAFVALTALLLAISLLLNFTVPEISDLSLFMISSAVMLVISIIELVIIRKRKGAGIRLKWVIGIGFIVSAILTTSTVGPVGSILFVFPMLLSIPYCSFLYSLFISAVTIAGTFVPLLVSSYMANYDLNVIRLVPGAVIRVASTLETSIGPEIIHETGTKINELLTTALPMILFVNVIAVVTVSITAAVRKSLLQQYRQFQTTRE